MNFLLYYSQFTVLTVNNFYIILVSLRFFFLAMKLRYKIIKIEKKRNYKIFNLAVTITVNILN